MPLSDKHTQLCWAQSCCADVRSLQHVQCEDSYQHHTGHTPAKGDCCLQDVYDSFEQLLHDLGAARQHGDTEHVASPDLQREYPTGHEVSAVALSAASCDGQGYLPGLEVPMLVVDHTLGMRAPYSNLWVGSNQGMELYVGCSHRGRYDMPFNDKVGLVVRGKTCLQAYY